MVSEMPVARQFGRGVIIAAISWRREVAIVPAGRGIIVAVVVVVVARFIWGVVAAFA
jgi:hypothetical protein